MNLNKNLVIKKILIICFFYTYNGLVFSAKNHFCDKKVRMFLAENTMAKAQILLPQKFSFQENPQVILKKILSQRAKKGDISQYFLKKFFHNLSTINSTLKTPLLGPHSLKCFKDFNILAVNNLVKWVAKLNLDEKSLTWKIIFNQLQIQSKIIFKDPDSFAKKRICSLSQKNLNHKKKQTCSIFSSSIWEQCQVK